MALKEANEVQAKAQAALAGLTPTKFVPPGTGTPVSVTLGMSAIKTFDKAADADAFVAKLDAALKPIRAEIEVEAVAAIKAALA